MTRNDLLAQLKELLPSQFDELLFRAGLPLEYLSASEAPQTTRAIELIRYLEQQNRLPEFAQAVKQVVAMRRSAMTTSEACAPAAQPRARSNRDAQHSRPIASLVVAAGAGVAALALLVLMLVSAQTLIRAGLTGHVWYVLLSLLGLFAAITVFSLFRSYACYRGKALGRALKLGGPVVVMLVVIVLGFYLVPAPPRRFDVTVFLHGKAGRQAMVLRNHGTVMLDLGPDKRVEAVGNKGEARFVGIPSDMRDCDVALDLDDDIYELVDPELTIRLNPEAVYAAIQARQLRLVGRVSDEHGRPLIQARAVVAETASVTDQDGRFEMKLPADLPDGDRSITITAAGYEPWHGRVVPGGDPLSVWLSPPSGDN